MKQKKKEILIDISVFRTTRFEAPEILEQYDKKNPNFRYLPSCDVFAFAMIMYCIVAESNTPLESYTSHTVGDAVKRGERPSLPCVSQPWIDLITSCWHQQP